MRLIHILMTICCILQRVPALSGSVAMGNVSHPTNIVIKAQTALMAVMKLTVVSCIYYCLCSHRFSPVQTYLFLYSVNAGQYAHD